MARPRKDISIEEQMEKQEKAVEKAKEKYVEIFCEQSQNYLDMGAVLG